MRVKLNRELAYAASFDAGNQAMRANGRKTWSKEDQLVASNEFDRLWPTCIHGCEPETCSDRETVKDLLEGNKTVQRPLHVREATFKKAPRSRPEAAQNLSLNLGDD
ncbi:MAG TPA: hypothetical protein VMU57_13060 [Edaphobacter sp.]|uniref:hypothetical protein n=1 Tax=Edaphobacter sp. TaxID=1934404 RepID=UPI002B7B1F74|nr:hypothetical protein [Edaphobacter sp.]HUZ95831.1 hypothetical protein [Edaphobacter sp.]